MAHSTVSVGVSVPQTVEEEADSGMNASTVSTTVFSPEKSNRSASESFNSSNGPPPPPPRHPPPPSPRVKDPHLRRRSINAYSVAAEARHSKYRNSTINASNEPLKKAVRSASVPDVRIPAALLNANVSLPPMEYSDHASSEAAMGVIQMLHKMKELALESENGAVSIGLDDILILRRVFETAIASSNDPLTMEMAIRNSTEQADDPLVQQYLLESFTPSAGKNQWSLARTQSTNTASEASSLLETNLNKAARIAGLPRSFMSHIPQQSSKLQTTQSLADFTGIRRESAPPRNSVLPPELPNSINKSTNTQLQPSANFVDTRSLRSQSAIQRNTLRPTASTQMMGGAAHPLGDVTDEIKAILSAIDEWGYDPFALRDLASGRVLRLTAWQCIQSHGLVDKLGLDALQVQRFLSAVEDAYMQNPYHNATHVADVTQTMHFFMKKCAMKSWMTPEQIYCSLLAAVIHDVGHPGVNNAYLVATSHPLAITYNDASPLENMHLALGFRIMQCAGFDPLSGLTEEQRRKIRADMIVMVLGTDNASHFTNLAALTRRIDSRVKAARSESVYSMSTERDNVMPSKSRRNSSSSMGSPAQPVQTETDSAESRPSGGGELQPTQSFTRQTTHTVNTQNSPSPQPASATSVGRRPSRASLFSLASSMEGINVGSSVEEPFQDAPTQLMIMQIALHAADVSNPTKPRRLYLQWIDMLLDEYYKQGDLERQNGLPVTPMLDRQNPIPLPNFQMGFLKAIVVPLFEELNRVPGVDMSEPLSVLLDNVAYWQAQLDAESPTRASETGNEK